MEKYFNPSKVIGYLRANWFQVTLFAILLMIVLRKDFSFQINMNNPDKEEIKNEYNSTEDFGKNSPLKKESFTENAQPKVVAKGSTSLFDRLDMGLFGSKNNSSSNKGLSTISEEEKLIYLKRFSNVAISERKKYGIPTSIILANGLLNSNAGQAAYSKAANNHFAIPCTIDWQGETVSEGSTCYRYYESSWASYRDHSRYLSSGKFASLLVLGPKDYKGWARGLNELNFSNKRHYGNELIKIIEYYELYRFDEK